MLSEQGFEIRNLVDGRPASPALEANFSSDDALQLCRR